MQWWRPNTQTINGNNTVTFSYPAVVLAAA